MPLPQGLAGAVIVITGASSGIGAETAVQLARRGAAVVLAARSASALDVVVGQCREAGGRAIAQPTDVRDLAAVRALGAAAVGTFGRVDAWVNCAAVGTYARFDEDAIDSFRTVIETNLLGTANGCAVALAHLRRNGGGVIVNIASILAEVSMPHFSGYNVSKHGIRGLGNAIRQELIADGDERISICTVLPGSVNTPFFDNAANRTGRAVRPPPPTYPVRLVSRRIVAALEHPRREVYVGAVAGLLGLSWRAAPARTERLIGRYAAHFQFANGRAPDTDGNLHRPLSAGLHEGEWLDLRHLNRAAVAGSGLTLVAAAALRRRWRRRSKG